MAMHSQASIRSWEWFLRTVGDDPFLEVLTHLAPEDVLHLAGSSLTCAQRMCEEERKSGDIDSLLLPGRFAGSALNADRRLFFALDSVLAARRKVVLKQTGTCTSALSFTRLRSLCWLYSDKPGAELVRSTAELCHDEPEKQNHANASASSTLLLGRRVLDNLFRWEVQRQNASSTATAGMCQAEWVEDAFTAVLGAAGADGSAASAAALTVKEAERSLDELVDLQPEMLPKPGGYEVMAKTRSAAEFLKGRLPGLIEPQSAAAKAGLQDLTKVVKSLDDTIRSWSDEGYGLACPLYTRRGVPYAHWWLFLGDLGQSCCGGDARLPVFLSRTQNDFSVYVDE